MALPPTTGAPLNLYVPPFDYGINPGDDTWDIPANDNWVALNNFAATTVLFNPTGNQTVTQPAATFLNINFPLIYTAANPTIRFGTAANAWDSALTRIGVGAFSLDTNTIGNAAATLKLGLLNATTGFQYNGAAPSGYVLVGNGTEYVGGVIASHFSYQTIQAAGVTRPQESKLNFIAPMTAVDNPGNGSTDVSLAASSAAGTYVAPTVTIDAYGRVTAASSSGLTRTTNSNGSYITFPDGTMMMWGVVNAPTTGATLVTVPIVFPTAFTTSQTLVVSGGSDPDSTNQDAYSIYHTGLNGSGATAVIRCSTNIGGSGASSLSNSVPVHWHAFGW